MRKYALMGLFAFAIFAAHSPKASAQSLEILQVETPKPMSVIDAAKLEQIKTQPEPAPTVPAPAPTPIIYTVAEGDTLSKIATDHGTTWKRLFNKNTQLTSPDILTVGTTLVIPTPDENLAERDIPAATPSPVTAPAPTYTAQPRGSVAGNGYDAGYCTWYVKNRRPDLPNSLGDASSWVYNARREGLTISNTPRAGAVGQYPGHVVYVENVNGDGTVTISEMNHAGLYVVTTRTLPASMFTYIY